MYITIVRTLILYLLVSFGMRVMGKRQIGDMQPSELVVTLLISEIAAIPIQDSSQPVTTAIVAIFSLVAIEIILAVLTLKSSLINDIVNGKPAIIIKDGKIIQDRLKRLRITVSDLFELLHSQGIFELNEVSYAIIETNGTLSVMQKPKFRNARIGDLTVENVDNDGYPALVVSDGKFVNRGISDVGTTKEHILKCLNKRKVKLSNCFIMTLDKFDNVYIVKKE